MTEPSTILIRNIFHMLCYAFRILRQQNYADIVTEEFAHVEDLLAAILARGIAKQLKQGLVKTYVDHHEQGTALRGKLNIFETKRLAAMKVQKVDCSFDELSENNELNQILRSTASALIRSSGVAARQKNSLRNMLLFFSNVSEIDLSSVQWHRLQYHRNNRNYEMLINICYLAYRSLLPSTEPGRTRFSMFDEESLPRLYEKFILEYYRQHFPSLHANDNPIRWDVPEDMDSSLLRLLPGMHSDIMLRCKNRTLIIDAKFYQHSLANYMGKQMVHSANLYQIYTYVKNEDKSHSGNVAGMLLYARTTEESAPSLSVPIGGNLISVRTLDLNKSFGEISASLDAIASSFFGTGTHRME